LGAVPQSSLAGSMGATNNVSRLRSCAFGCSLAGTARVKVYVERARSLRPVSQRRCIRPFSPSTDGVSTAVAVPYEEFVRRLHACRVKDALASGKTPPPNPPLLSDRCVPYKPRGAADSGARRATSDVRSAGGAGSVAPTLVAAAPVARGSASGSEAGASAGGAPGKSAPVGRGPPSDTESDKSGRTRAREKRAAGTRRGAMPRPTMANLGGAGGGDESEWNQSSGGSVASSSTGGAPTPQHQGRRASGGPRRGGGAGAKKKGPGNGKGNVWTVDEQVALCEALKLVAQRSDMGADWSKDGLWDSMKDMGVKAAKRMRNNKEDMQESAGVLGVEVVRSRKTMEAMVSEAAKRTQLESKRAATAFFNLAENKGTDEAKTFFEAMRKDMFNIGMAAINATAPAAVASGAVAVRGASPSTKSATAAGASAAAAASATMAAGGGKEPVVASSDDSDATTNVAEASGLDKRGSAERVRLPRGRHAMAAKSKVGQARIDKNQAAIDLTRPDVAGGSSVTAPTARGDMRSRGA